MQISAEGNLIPVVIKAVIASGVGSLVIGTMTNFLFKK
jgi:hypothetical protein